MECPYCKEEMKTGHIHAPASQGAYWLPETSRIDGVILSIKKIKEVGGILIDEVSKAGFISQNKPQTYYCEECSVFITKKCE